jgi:hypothetical protein
MAINKSEDMLLKAAAGEKPLRLALYLPSQHGDGTAIEGFEETADEVAGLLCRRFGGATTYGATGHFTCRDGLRRESVRVVEFFCAPGNLDRERHFLYGLINRLGNELDQENMALSIDGSLLLLPRTTLEAAVLVS